MKIKRIVHRLRRYPKEERILAWKSNTSKVELEITTVCNLRCYNCDRSCRQAPSPENMSLQQIHTFVDESSQLNHDWINIAILGGEPTLHPRFFKILDIMNIYKKKHPGTRIELVTNGYGQMVNTVLKQVPAWVKITNMKKKSNVQKFSSYNVAPIDLGKFSRSNFSKGCEITEYCGLGLTRYGYYPCGAGASVDRVFGFDIGIKTLADCNRKKLRQQLHLLCRYCGHFKDRNMWHYNTETEEKMSKTWQDTYNKYQKEKPGLTLY